MLDKQIAVALHLPQDSPDEDVASAILNLVISAIHDTEPPKSLAEIYHDLTTLGAASHLDPLNAIPLLLPCDDLNARNIIDLVGECGPAKEVVVTVQEAVERLERTLEGEDDEEERDEETELNIKRSSPINQLLTLIGLYAAAIPRIKLRRKSASETIQPLLEELESVIHLASAHATQQEACGILSSVAKLSSSIEKWVAASDAENDVDICNNILRDVLDRSLLACRHGLHTSIAQRTLEKCYPRLAFKSASASQSSNISGESEIMEWLDAYKSLNIGKANHVSPSDLIFHAYILTVESDVEKFLSFILPALISSIQTNQFLDESLAILISYLHAWNTTKPGTYLPHDITTPLCGLIPSVASAHPDPIVRHQTFRVLSLLLSAADPRLQFQHLLEYSRDSEYPQMRSAAVGLVKDALLRSLSNPNPKENPFCTSLFLRSFGPVLFRPEPQDLLSETLTLPEFEETSEPGRLVECLSLYYVLLKRDSGNLTGIRDKDVQKSIEHTLLSPLRVSIDRWMANSDTLADGHSHTSVASSAVSLSICLQRVYAALNE